MERDKGKKGKVSKKRKHKKKASKKGKKKKDKDLTPDRTTESLYEELVLNGIIKTYPKVRLSEYLGDISYTGESHFVKLGTIQSNHATFYRHELKSQSRRQRANAWRWGCA